MLAEPILKLECDVCKLRTEHALSKNVRGEVMYICLRCGKDIAFADATTKARENDTQLPSDDAMPVGVG